MPRRRQTRQRVPIALVRFAEDTNVLANPQVQRLVTAATVTDQPALQHRLTQLVVLSATQTYAQPFQPPAPEQVRREDLHLGTTITGSPSTLDVEDLTRHLLVIGQSGAGKTTLFYNLMQQLAVPFWSFDLKQDYRHLLTTDMDLMVLPWTELRFNPLQPPPGVPPRRWAQVVSEIFGHATALLSASKNYLLKQLFDLYEAYNLFTDVSPPYPSLHELQHLVATDKINYVRKTADYRDTVLNRLEAMTLAAGTIFDCSEGYPLTELLEQTVVFEFDGLSRDVQNFLMEVLFAAVYEYRVAQNQRDAGLNHVFFLDEGKQVFSVYKERQDAAGLPAIDELTAKMREFGEGLIVADQEASKLTASIKANTQTKVLLATGDATQFREMADAMRLSARQRDIAYRLGIGDAIVQTGNRTPCPVQLDSVAVEKTISDAVLQQRQRQVWNALSATPREQPAAFTEQGGKPAADADAEPFPTDPPRQDGLSAVAKRLLTDIIEHPFRALTDRYDEFASTYQGNKAKNELVDHGIVIERKVHAGPEKRKLLELTDHGRDYADTYLEVDTKHRGRGGIIHRYWQYRLKQVVEAAGWTAKREAFDADVYVNLGEAELGIEVAMGNNTRELDHVEQHLDTFDAVWIICRDEAVRDGIRKRLAENGLLTDRVTLRLVRDIPGPETVSVP